jgi:hypothetical protein
LAGVSIAEINGCDPVAAAVIVAVAVGAGVVVATETAPVSDTTGDTVATASVGAGVPTGTDMPDTGRTTIRIRKNTAIAAREWEIMLAIR